MGSASATAPAGIFHVPPGLVLGLLALPELPLREHAALVEILLQLGQLGSTGQLPLVNGYTRKFGGWPSSRVTC